MDKQDIIRMAREAGATPYTNRHYPDRTTNTFNVELHDAQLNIATVNDIAEAMKIIKSVVSSGGATHL